MNEKPFAGFVTAFVIAPLVILCCVLGPVVLGSAVGAIVSWSAGLTPMVLVSAAVAAGLVIYGVVRWRRAQLSRGGDAVAAPSCGPGCNPASHDRVHGDEFRP